MTPPSSPGGQAAPEPSGQVTEAEIANLTKEEFDEALVRHKLTNWNGILCLTCSLEWPCITNRFFTEHIQYKQRIRELEAALRRRSIALHDVTHSLHWDTCPLPRCISDRDLLAPPGQERGEEVQGG